MKELLIVLLAILLLIFIVSRNKCESDPGFHHVGLPYTQRCQTRVARHSATKVTRGI
jgi:hypothetical protein